MSEYKNEFCNCSECPFFNADFPHYCGLGQAMKVHVASVRDAVENCHCVNPTLLELFVKLGDGGMNEVCAPIDYAAMGKEYLAQADAIGEKVAQLKREYKRSGSELIRVQMENWREIEADLRHQGLDFLRRGERRKREKGENV